MGGPGFGSGLFVSGKHLFKQTEHRGPALSIGAGIISWVRLTIECLRIGEPVFYAGIAVKMPVSFDTVHFLPEPKDLLSWYKGVGIAMAHEYAGLDFHVCGECGFEHPVEAEHSC